MKKYDEAVQQVLESIIKPDPNNVGALNYKAWNSISTCNTEV
jgi:hypothetical protein